MQHLRKTNSYSGIHLHQAMSTPLSLSLPGAGPQFAKVKIEQQLDVQVFVGGMCSYLFMCSQRVVLTSNINVLGDCAHCVSYLDLLFLPLKYSLVYNACCVDALSFISKPNQVP